MTGRPVQMMGFGDAVKNAIVNNYGNLSGRASRSEYWWFFLFTSLAGLVAGIIDALVFGVELNGPTWVSWILQLALSLPTLAVSVRRIHDHGKSGWFVIVPLYNLYLVIVDGEAMPNAYGEVPTNTLFDEVINNRPEPNQQIAEEIQKAETLENPDASSSEPTPKTPRTPGPKGPPPPRIKDTPSSSNQWRPLFVKDSVYRWEGKKGATIIKAKIGRLIIAKEGVIFVSSGSSKISSQFSKSLIPIVGGYLAATSGASTVNLDSTDLSKAGSLKIPKSDLTSFRVEGGFMSGRYLRIYSRSNGDYSFMTKIGFNKSEVQILNRLENINLW